MRLELPWFNPCLAPNRPKHFREKAAARKKQRALAYIIARGFQNKPRGETLAMSIMFHPPTKHRRDLDNCLAAIKGAIDGIADAIGIDDTNFRPITIDFGGVVRGGKIIIEINADNV